MNKDNNLSPPLSLSLSLDALKATRYPTAASRKISLIYEDKLARPRLPRINIERLAMRKTDGSIPLINNAVGRGPRVKIVKEHRVGLDGELKPLNV